MPIIDQIKQHIETDLSDEALGRVISDAVTEVESRFGTDAEMSIVKEGRRRYLRLLRPALSITSVTERTTWTADEVTVDAANYALVNGGRTLFRKDVEFWEMYVTITYVPVPEIDIRDRMVIDLVKLELSFNGAIHSTKIGDYQEGGSVTPDSYQRERENILAGAANRRGLRFV